ncbi:MAG: cell division protein FtsN [Gammaproteobacteria bacterium]|nr:MAG: cell division protein FtsN [Gammaproteobacteria bacterium]PHR81790.1 MAG: cell division protein FtsN [Colwellia sp.]
MSNQDYITRTPAKKKKNNPYKQNTPAPKSTVKAKIIGLIVIVLIAAFAYSLWFLKTSPKTKAPIQAVTTAPAAKESNLPAPPKEKWTYVENLKTKEIEVGQYEVTQKGPYRLQCGSFKTTRRAETLKATIAFVGLEATIKKSIGSNGTWYKVILGPYARKRLAEQDKHKLRNNSVNRCQVLLWK